MPQKLEDFWNQQLIDIQFLKRFGIVEHNVQRVVLGTLNSFQEVSSLSQKWMITMRSFHSNVT